MGLGSRFFVFGATGDAGFCAACPGLLDQLEVIRGGLAENSARGWVSTCETAPLPALRYPGPWRTGSRLRNGAYESRWWLT